MCQVSTDIIGATMGQNMSTMFSIVDYRKFDENKQIVFALRKETPVSNLTPYGQIIRVTTEGCLLRPFSRLTGDLLDRQMFIRWDDIENYCYEDDFTDIDSFQEAASRFMNFQDFGTDTVDYFDEVKPETLSQLISRRLNDLGLNKAELARRLGMSRAYITSLANGNATTRSGQHRPSSDVIAGLAKHLRVSEARILSAIGDLPFEKLSDPTKAGGLSIPINSEIQLILQRRDIRPEDQEEYERAVATAIAIAEQRIAEKHKN